MKKIGAVIGIVLLWGMISTIWYQEKELIDLRSAVALQELRIETLELIAKRNAAE